MDATSSFRGLSFLRAMCQEYQQTAYRIERVRRRHLKIIDSRTFRRTERFRIWHNLSHLRRSPANRIYGKGGRLPRSTQSFASVILRSVQGIVLNELRALRLVS